MHALELQVLLSLSHSSMPHFCIYFTSFSLHLKCLPCFKVNVDDLGTTCNYYYLSIFKISCPPFFTS